MKNNNLSEEQLKAILQEHGLEKTTEEFSSRLSHLIVRGHKRNPTIEYKAEKWLGKIILAVLVLFNLLIFCYINPFSIQPVLFISISAFVFGVWGVIALAKRSQVNIS